MGFYTCKPKSRKWTITAFCYVIDMARVKTYLCYNKNRQKKFNENLKTRFLMDRNFIAIISVSFILSLPKTVHFYEYR